MVDITLLDLIIKDQGKTYKEKKWISQRKNFQNI